MNHTVRYRLSHSISLCLLCISVVACAVFATMRMLSNLNTNQMPLYLLLLLLSLFAVFMLSDRLIRIFSRIGCFRVTGDGILHFPAELRFGFLRFSVPIREIPWQCIKDIRFVHINARPYLSFALIDEADFPKAYSPTVRFLLERNRRMDVYALRADVSDIAADPSMLAEKLQQLLSEYQNENFD